MKRKFLMILVTMVMGLSAGHAREPARGYRGFIDCDITYGMADWVADYDGMDKHEVMGFMGFATSHGYQINRHAYLGGGFMLSLGYPCIMLPLFADFRYDFKFGKWKPYADCRLGYSISDGGGIYFSPTVGYRCNWGRKANFNIGVGLTLCGATASKYERKLLIGSAPADSEYPDEPEYIIYYKGEEHKYYPRFSLRLGFDF